LKSQREPALLDRRTVAAAGAALLGAGCAGSAWAARGKAAAEPVVETTAGRIRGLRQGPVHVFKGVPYGASTAGGQRFMAPQKPLPWSGVRDAVALGPKAPQVTETLLPELMAFQPKDEVESEDCLRLNVWTTGLGDRRRPVMVWFHGGQFLSGSGGNPSYDGSALATREDVVVVTVNHRLNVFGYLHLAEIGGAKYAASGAAGVLDLVLALEWVRDNIERFGGDPGRVTIFGESGGGGKVSTLLAMPAARGLFHRSIIQSGIRMRLTTPEEGTAVARRVLSQLGLGPNQVDQLQTVPFPRLIEAVTSARPGVNFAPVVDGRMIPTHPYDPAAPAPAAGVPLLIGSNATETTFHLDTPLDPIDGQTLRDRVKRYTRSSDAEAEALIRGYRAARPKDSDLHLYHVISSDYWRRADAITTAERKHAQGGAPAYMYYFTWETPVRQGKLRSPHTLDVPFVFDNVDRAAPITGTGRDRYPLARAMSRAWAAFARTGDPSVRGLEWPRYTPDRRATLIFDRNPRVVNDPDAEDRRLMAEFKARQAART
jgi:para-nitrobenzyl esterase